jgi:hypothetical protein
MQFNKQRIQELKESFQRSLNSEEEPHISDVVDILECSIQLCDYALELLNTNDAPQE